MSFAYSFAFSFGGGVVGADETLITRYQDQLQKLMPPGPALNRRTGSGIGQWLKAFSVELSRVHLRVDDLYQESYPGTASETLDTWEELCGLPTDCSYIFDTPAQRQAAILRRFAVDWGQAESDFEAIATERGYTIVIELWDIFRVGVHTIGHMPLYSTPHYFAFVVHYTPQDPATDAALECAIRNHAHAHTVVQFNLTDSDGFAYPVTHPRT